MKEAGLEPNSNMPIPLLGAPRYIRVRAAERLDALLLELIAKMTSFLADVERARRKLQ